MTERPHPATRLILGALLLFAPAGAALSCRSAEEVERERFERVEKNAVQLYEGRSVNSVRALLGDPSRTDPSGTVWTYMPARSGRVVPAKALRLRFQDGALAEWGWRPVVLGAPMDF